MYLHLLTVYGGHEGSAAIAAAIQCCLSGPLLNQAAAKSGLQPPLYAMVATNVE